MKTVEVEVNWAEVAYPGVEGNEISVCALHIQQTQKNFTVDIVSPNTPGKLLSARSTCATI